MPRLKSSFEPLEPRTLFALSFTPTTLDAGPAPVRLATADFNNDGNADLVLANVGDQGRFPGVSFGISLLLGNGDGTFQPRSLIYQRTDQDSTSLYVLDLNRDGFQDIVISDAILLNNGNANSPTTFTVSPRSPTASDFDVADLTGDGVPDIVYSESFQQDPELAIGNGDGTFAAPIPLPLTTASPSSTTPAPLSSKFQPLENLGSDGNNGNTQLTKYFDADGDGITDLIKVRPFSDEVLVYYGESRFATKYAKVSLAFTYEDFRNQRVVSYQANAVTAAKYLFNITPPQTLSLLAQPTGTIPVSNPGFIFFIDSSDGSFNVTHFESTTSLAAATTYPLGSFPKSLDIGDLNNDGNYDVVIAENFSADITYLLGNGDGTFQPRVTLPAGQRPNDALFVDLNNDGLTDIVNTNTFDDTLTVHLNTTPLGTPTGGPGGTDPLKTAPKLRLTSSSFNIKPDVTFTLTATASPTGNAAAPTGTINFFDGQTFLGSATLSSNGTATLNTSLTAGTHLLTAVFTGSDQYAPAASPTLKQPITPAVSPPPPPDSRDLTVTGTPTTPITAGAKLAPITITAGDGLALPKGAKVTPTIASGPSGATLTGPKSAPFKKGIATLKNLSFRTAGTYTLTFTSAEGIGSVTTSSFTIIPAAPKKATFSSIPATLSANATFTATVSLTDKYGNAVTTDNTTAATLSLPGKASDFLKGTLTRTATAGLLTFDTLTITTPGRYSIFAKPTTKGISPAKATITVT